MQSYHQRHTPTPVILCGATLGHDQDYPVRLFSSNMHNEVSRSSMAPMELGLTLLQFIMIPSSWPMPQGENFLSQEPELLEQELAELRDQGLKRAVLIHSRIDDTTLLLNIRAAFRPHDPQGNFALAKNIAGGRGLNKEEVKNISDFKSFNDLRAFYLGVAYCSIVSGGYGSASKGEGIGGEG
jgi:hypothetical protein